jgi:hypothetical protein
VTPGWGAVAPVQGAVVSHRGAVASEAPAGPILLGVRHHGPGSARAVVRALAAYQPEIVLVEGPPEADPLVRFAASADLRPPVALLAYPLDATVTGRAAFWPFAEFSPEWQAIRWAVDHGVPVRFCDLPVVHRFSVEPEVERQSDGVDPSTVDPSTVDAVRADPIAGLAHAAGYDDPERWWEDVVEHQRGSADGGHPLADALAPFQAIAEAMAAVRAHAPAPPPNEDHHERRREAYMRTVLRAAVKAHSRVAVVCGAWHVPALTPPLPKVGEDAALLRGLSKTKVAMTWVPWTHGRLASWQGYGAGVHSPGWYHHLFTAPDHTVERWLVGVARVLRDEGLPVSSAHVIEAVRLADTLAHMRGRPIAGLSEVTEATQAVLCDGDPLRLELVNRRLVVGERLGTVPDDTPGVPLARDVAAAQRRLRLPPEALVRDLDLDLRRDYDLERSRLLHRMRLLGVDWGLPAESARRGKGTFWEPWRLCWQPEFAVDLVAASAYGITVASAAANRVTELAARARSLAGVTALAERCLLADLPDALDGVLRALDERIALDPDVAHLMAALPALARSLRYGDVRGTDTSALRGVAEGLLVRICVGLPPALAALDDEAAAAMRRRIDALHSAVALLDRTAAKATAGPAQPADGAERPTEAESTDRTARSEGPAEAEHSVEGRPTHRAEPPAEGRSTHHTEPSAEGRSAHHAEPSAAAEPTGAHGPAPLARWLATIGSLASRDDVHGLLVGTFNRLLLDAGRLPADEARRRLGLVLTVGVPPAHGAAWVEGFLAGGGLLLVHDERLLNLVDAWLAAIPADTFLEVLPLLRRTFGEFAIPERHAIGQRVRRREATGSEQPGDTEYSTFDTERGALVLPTVALLLGWDTLPEPVGVG